MRAGTDIVSEREIVRCEREYVRFYLPYCRGVPYRNSLIYVEAFGPPRRPRVGRVPPTTGVSGHVTTSGIPIA
ncbi:hypothetical protein EVAR_67316_1 [Eumeta japonica]|uniref:Uncharacterized protein n=1 Tax=Eumeta variegata TaxID=151549 RepID=A0A4C1ZA87_EUMVA|nr:hypothetical protein EVAR_67316_1 [Eumeta japonica]